MFYLTNLKRLCQCLTIYESTFVGHPRHARDIDRRGWESDDCPSPLETRKAPTQGQPTVFKSSRIGHFLGALSL